MLYQRAVTANPKDSYGLYRYAQFFDKCQMPEEAEEVYFYFYFFWFLVYLLYL